MSNPSIAQAGGGHYKHSEAEGAVNRAMTRWNVSFNWHKQSALSTRSLSLHNPYCGPAQLGYGAYAYLPRRSNFARAGAPRIHMYLLARLRNQSAVTKGPPRDL